MAAAVPLVRIGFTALLLALAYHLAFAVFGDWLVSLMASAMMLIFALTFMLSASRPVRATAPASSRSRYP